MRTVNFPVNLADVADAFRLLQPNPEAAEQIARVLGFEARVTSEEAGIKPEFAPHNIIEPREANTQRDVPTTLSTTAGERLTEQTNTSLKVRRVGKAKRGPGLLNLPAHIRRARPLPGGPRGVLTIPPASPLLPHRLLRAFLMDAVGDNLQDDSIDIELAVEQIASLHLHQLLPRRRRKGFRSGLQLWIDESPAMRPFRHDVDELRSAVRRIVGPSYEGEFFFDSPPFLEAESASDGETVDSPKLPKLRAGMSLLLLTDLGIGRPPLKPRVSRGRWLSFARVLAARGIRPVAVVPYSPGRWPTEVSKRIKVVHWHSGRSHPAPPSKQQIRSLARALSIGSRIDPTLLREVRRRFLPDSDAGLEADFLFSSLVSVYNPRAIALRREVLLKLREELANDPTELQQTFDFHQEYGERAGYHFTDSFEEQLVFLSLRRDVHDQTEVRVGLSRMVRSLIESEGDSDLCRWVLNCLKEFPRWVQELDEAQHLLATAELRLGLNPMRLEPGEFSDNKSWMLPDPTSVGISLVGNTLTLREPPESDEPVIEVPATRPRVVFVQTKQGKPTTARFRVGQPANIKLYDLPVELQTLAGARFRLEGARTPARRLPPGVKLLHTLRGHEGVIGRISWSPNGRLIASPSLDRTIRIWDTVTGDLVRTLYADSDTFNCLCWSGDGRYLASSGDDHTVNLWETETGRLINTLIGHEGKVWDVAASPDSPLLASASADGTIRLWDIQIGEAVRTLSGNAYNLSSVAWSQEGKVLASGSWSGIVTVWDASDGRALATLEGHRSGVTSVIFLPHGEQLASAGLDGTIRIWELDGMKMTQRLEGHTGSVNSLAVSTDGRCLASKGGDGTVRLWKYGSWETVAIINEPASAELTTGITFNPTISTLATVGSDAGRQGLGRDTLIHVWELDFEFLLGTAPKTIPVTEAVHHTTAKIVLVGDSGVGKTGLGWRLAHGEYKEHSSTHGQQFWVIDELGKQREDGTECEAILWDLAGQPDYRLTHALFLDDADLALVLFDPTDSRDPLHGVEFWLKQLKAGMASSAPGQEAEGGEARKLCPTILVGGRSDRGEARLTQQELDGFCRQHGISGGYLATSAKDATGLNDLVRRMREQIPWEQKPATVTTVTFKRIKDYVLGMKENRRIRKVIVSPQDLRKRLEKTDKRWRFTDAEMLTAVRHLSNYGYVRVLQTSMGEERILLSPELLNNLAASFVLEARRNQKGLGSLEEKRLLAGEYGFRELETLTEEERSILLDSAALLFLNHNVCFRETDLSAQSYLVFPELINLKKPLLEGDETEDSVAYTVSGAIENVYASLVVLLGYTQTFTRTNQWRNQARYEVGDGLICGFRQDDEREGELNLVLYFGTNVGKPVRTLFQGLFESFLARRNLSVFRYEPAVCANGHTLDRSVMRERLRDGSAFAFCPECGDKLALPKAHEPIQLTQKERRKVDEQRWLADQRTRFEQAIFRLASYVEDQKLDRPECFISYAWGEREWERWVERNLASDLQKAGIGVVLDRWENDRAGKSVSRFLSRIAECGVIIPVGTPLYLAKFENKVSSTGSVVAAEVDLINQRLMGTEAEKETVMPVLLAGEKKSSLPPLMWDRVHRDFRNERAYFITAFDLILDLYGIAPGDTAVADLRESLRVFEMR